MSDSHRLESGLKQLLYTAVDIFLTHYIPDFMSADGNLSNLGKA